MDVKKDPKRVEVEVRKDKKRLIVKGIRGRQRSRVHRMLRKLLLGVRA